MDKTIPEGFEKLLRICGLRPDLPPLIPRIAALPVDAERGYPIPYFVAYIDGKPDFRIADGEKFVLCIRNRWCWVCGQPLGVHLSFVIGPMCAITRTTAEPPAHHDCAHWSIRGCPFMMRPKMVRREGGFKDSPDHADPGGIMITRNPGVMCHWTTKAFAIFKDDKGKPLIQVGEPESVTWWQEGRSAKRHEVLASIESGMPELIKACHMEKTPADAEHALAELDRQRHEAERWLPAV